VIEWTLFALAAHARYSIGNVFMIATSSFSSVQCSGKRSCNAKVFSNNSVELGTSGTKSKLVELKKTYASSVRNQNNRVDVDLAECEEK